MISALRDFGMILCFWGCCAPAAFSQHYLRGEVKNEAGVAIQNAKIYFPSTRKIYYSGATGGFGIPSSSRYDSLIVTGEGYDSLCVRLNMDSYQALILKPYSLVAEPEYREMASYNSGITEASNSIAVYGGETYSNLVENSFVTASEVDHTTFGLRIDKASYSNIRRFINRNMPVPRDAVRVEELVNYFNLRYREPPESQQIGIQSKVTDCPWNPAHRLLLFDFCAKKLDLNNLPPSNFVFLIDVSGSMELPNRLSLLKEAFPFLINNLRTIDTVSIVIYGGNSGIWLTPTGGDDKEKIITAIEKLTASGSTPGEAALRIAYQLAENTFIEGGNNRIILATDGDFNVGSVAEKELEKLVLSQRDKGIYLTCLGVGMGNYKDSKLEVLAKSGNGNFSYLDDLAEAEKVLLKEFTQTMYTVADDVYADIRFDSSVFKNYRLIGYDNERSDVKDFISKPLGGSLGSGYGTTVMFEVVPANADDILTETSAGQMTLHYAHTGSSDLISQRYDFTFNYKSFNELDKSHRFVIALAMFGLKLKRSAYFPDLPWSAVREIAINSANTSDYLQNQFVELIDKYEKMTGKKRR